LLGIEFDTTLEALRAVERIVRTERYKRGVFGWIFKGLFIAFNLFMVFATGGLLWFLTTRPELTNNPGIAGAFIGMVLIWGLGALLLGLLSYFTRGDKVIIEERIQH
jgi:hypothetical protein